MKLQFDHPRPLVGLTVLIGLLLTTPASAAAPNLVMIYGPSLVRPIILTDWQENGQLIPTADQGVAITPNELIARPYFNLALFWGPAWMEYMNAGKPLNVLQPDQANQHAKFYPAVGTADPIFVFDSIPGPGPLIRRMNPSNLAVLTKYGVPISLTSLPTTGRSSSIRPLWLIASGALIVAGAAMRIVHRPTQGLE